MVISDMTRKQVIRELTQKAGRASGAKRKGDSATMRALVLRRWAKVRANG